MSSHTLHEHLWGTLGSQLWTICLFFFFKTWNQAGLELTTVQPRITLNF